LFGDEFFVSSGVYQQATFYRVTFSAGYHTVFFFFTQGLPSSFFSFRLHQRLPRLFFILLSFGQKPL